MSTARKNRLKRAILDYREKDEAAVYFFAGLMLFVTAVLTFSHMVYNYYSIGSWSYDTKVYAFLQSMRSDSLDAFFKTITVVGNTVPAIVMTLVISTIFFFVFKGKEYVYFAINILGAWLLNEVLKAVIRRPRPIDQRLIDLTNMTKVSKEFGFPSGHSMVIMATAILLIYFILLYSKKSYTLCILCALLFLSALLIGISRVYLGVHYFSDVVAGWTVGILWSAGSIMFHRFSNYRKNIMHN